MEDNNSILVMLGELRGDMKHILAALQSSKDDHTGLSKRVSDLEDEHHTRISRLEQFRWKILGAVGLISLIIPALMVYLEYLL